MELNIVRKLNKRQWRYSKPKWLSRSRYSTWDKIKTGIQKMEIVISSSSAKQYRNDWKPVIIIHAPT